MKWFKHDTDACRDPKLRKLMMKYGLPGYGLYWYCLELISHEITAKKLTFELEHDSEILAHETGLGRELIEDMIKFMVQIGLFQNTDGRIYCMQLLNRIDLSQGGSPEFRKAITAKKSCVGHDAVMTESCLEVEVEVDIKKICADVEQNALFVNFWKHYPNKKGKAHAEKSFNRLSRTDQELAYDDALARAKSDPDWTKENGKYIPMPATYLNGRRWEDEWKPVNRQDWGI